MVTDRSAMNVSVQVGRSEQDNVSTQHCYRHYMAQSSFFFLHDMNIYFLTSFTSPTYRNESSTRLRQLGHITAVQHEVMLIRENVKF